MSHAGRKSAVYIVTVPDQFRPQRPWDFPQLFTGGEVFTRNVNVAQARGFVFCFNKRQMALGIPDRKWAIAAGHAKQRWHDREREAAMAREAAGGHATADPAPHPVHQPGADQ